MASRSGIHHRLGHMSTFGQRLVLMLKCMVCGYLETYFLTRAIPPLSKVSPDGTSAGLFLPSASPCRSWTSVMFSSNHGEITNALALLAAIIESCLYGMLIS
jgi:hypothetical protein